MSDANLDFTAWVKGTSRRITPEAAWNASAAHERSRLQAAYSRSLVSQQNAALADLAAILAALGLSDHARPASPHAVVRDEILPAIASLRREAGATTPLPGENQRRCWTITPTPGGKSAQCRLFNGHEEEEHYFGPPAEPQVDQQAHLGECLACGEESPRGECPASKRPCGHHCNCSWTQDACCWCGAVFGEECEV